MVRHGTNAGVIDLGNEPPLSIDNDETADSAPIRRAVSWRWLAGTVLTGVTSIALMGTALVAALNSPNQFASLPEAFAAISPAEGGILFGSKSDRMQQIEEQVSSRQILQVSTVTRQGERDFIKLRPFAKVSATLALGSPDLAAEVPAFDVLRIFADTSAPEAEAAAPEAEAEVAGADDQLYGANVDGDVAVRVSVFPINDPDLEPTADLDAIEVEHVVRAAARIAVDEEVNMTALSFVDPARDDTGNNDPFSALGVRIVPENVSNIAKTDAAQSAEGNLREAVIAVAKDGDLRSLLQSNDLAGNDADEIVAALSQLVDVNNLHPGQKIRMAYAAEPSDAAVPPLRVSIYDNGAHQATVARADSNAFVRADEPASVPAILADVEPEAPAPGGLPKLYDAVYQTALDQQISKPLVDQLIRMFAFDVDFQARITPGDALNVFHSLPDPDDRDATEPEILFASLILNGVSKPLYRFRTPDDGIVDFYDIEGKSAKKFLLRKPVAAGIMRSSFGMRRHPVVGVRRMHSGVDYAAPRGTPILAAGNGVVEKAGRSSGYGNFTLIKHTNGYQTAYAHQTSFAKGMVPGARVRQGQVIGYVGSTGLSTGPHLHFEIRINGKAVDPLRVRLPRGRVLQTELLTAFELERERIDALLGLQPAPTTLASNN